MGCVCPSFHCCLPVKYQLMTGVDHPWILCVCNLSNESCVWLLGLNFSQMSLCISRKRNTTCWWVQLTALYSVCVFVGTFMCLCVCPPPYFDSIRGSLHTPCRNLFSHSGPPVAVATSPWCWMTWKGYGGTTDVCAHTCTRGTRSEKYFANAGNY